MFSAQIKSWFEARLPGAISHSVRDLSFKVKMGKITSLHLSTYFQEKLNIKSTELSLIDQKCVTVCVTEHDGFEPHVHVFSFFIIIIVSSRLLRPIIRQLQPWFPSFIFMSFLSFFPIFISFLSFPLSCPHSSCFLPPLSSFFHSFNPSFPWFICLIFIFFYFLLHFFFIIIYFILFCLSFFFSLLSLCAFYSLFFLIYLFWFLFPVLSIFFSSLVFPFFLHFRFLFIYFSLSMPQTLSIIFLFLSLLPSLFPFPFALPPFSLILLSFQSFSLPCFLVSLSPCPFSVT